MTGPGARARTNPWRWILLVLGGGAALLLALIALVRREAHVLQGQEIVYDDFAFCVVEHRTEAELDGVAPSGTFHVVRLDVRNHAQRVDYALENFRPLLVDEDGTRYEVAPAAQRVLDARDARARPTAIGPGESFAWEFAFDVPAGRERLRLAVSFGGSWIDLIDWAVSGPRDIALR